MKSQGNDPQPGTSIADQSLTQPQSRRKHREGSLEPA